MHQLCIESSICTHRLFNERLIHYLLIRYILKYLTMQHRAKKYMLQI